MFYVQRDLRPRYPLRGTHCPAGFALMGPISYVANFLQSQGMMSLLKVPY